jgi:hypothetical protein
MKQWYATSIDANPVVLALRLNVLEEAGWTIFDALSNPR